MHSEIPLTRDVVFIGGGHAHALVLRKWAMAPLPGARLTLINPDPSAPYTGMLPGYVAGHYRREELEIDLVRLSRVAGARLILGRATSIDRATRSISVTGHPDVHYDIASIDIGISSDLPTLPGFPEHAVAAKPLGAFAQRWAEFVARDHTGCHVVIIGGGVAGVELSLAAQHRLAGRGSVTVVEADTLLAEISPAARRRLGEELRAAGVNTLEKSLISEIRADRVVLNDGRELPSDFTLGAAGARPQDWLKTTGLDLTAGFIEVDETLRTISDRDIYAVGDCAHLVHAPRPKAGVFAVRQAPVLFHNLSADLTGSQRRTYKPQRDYLKLISLGRQAALMDKHGVQASGDWLWRLKDRIDRRFMHKFEHLPEMPPPELPKTLAKGVRETLAGGKPLCGGCGAKVGASSLDASLADLGPPTRADIVSGPGDDAALIRCGTSFQAISTDHLRSFVNDPYLMSRITAVHALGDVWAMGGAPQALLSQIILPRMSAELQERTLREILTAAAELCAEVGADLVGGHTSIGSELTIGYTVTGTVDRPISLSGAQPGDLVVLTKPLGTGVLLAAEMQADAAGTDIAALWQQMAQPQVEMARNLARVAHAMTDVTGFGLMGHLDRMCAASEVGAQIDLEAVPVCSGALDLIERGHESSLYKENRRGFPDLADETPRQRLMFDPQTSGGLMAAVPADAVPAGVWVIGEIRQTPDVRFA